MDIPTQYCEASGFQLINVITSLFFLVFAFIAYKKTRLKLLPILLVFIGVGSTLWHATALPIGDVLDTLSITIFSVVATYFIFSKVITNKVLVFLSLVALLGISFFLEQVSILNNSLVYIFLLFVLCLFGIFYTQKIPTSKQNIITALLLFAIAIGFRIFDPFFCKYLPIGTHFIWHMLMAFVGYQLIHALNKAPKL